MKTINKHNYEIFFLDFIEENLPESQVADLNKFLSEHPELKNELERFEEISLQPENIEYKNKENLIKQTQSQFFEITHFEYLAIADTENENTEIEKLELQKEIKNTPGKLNEFKLIKKTKLSADKNITYPFKSRLIKKTSTFSIQRSIYAAAALVTVLLMINQIYFKTDVSTQYGKQTVSMIKKNKKAFESKHENINTKIKQEAIISHNQTNKQIKTNNLLAFNDNEPHAAENSYEEISVQIPEIKHEALILNKPNPEIDNFQIKTALAKNDKSKKEKLWKYAETSVNLWKKVSASDFEMNNTYNEDGTIEKLNVYASNFKISRTFNK